MGCIMNTIWLYLRLTCVVPKIQNVYTQGLIIWYLHFTYNKNNEVLLVVPTVLLVCTHITCGLYPGYNLDIP